MNAYSLEVDKHIVTFEDYRMDLAGYVVGYVTIDGGCKHWFEFLLQDWSLSCCTNEEDDDDIDVVEFDNIVEEGLDELLDGLYTDYEDVIARFNVDSFGWKE